MPTTCFTFFIPVSEVAGRKCFHLCASVGLSVHRGSLCRALPPYSVEGFNPAPPPDVFELV